MSLDGGTNDVRRQAVLIHDEIIWMNRFDTVCRQSVVRKISEIERHDGVGVRSNRGSQDVAIIGVRQCKGRNQRFVSADKTIADMNIHQLTRPLKLLSRQIRSIPEHAARPFVMNCIRPLRPEQIGERQMHQQISQRRRIQNASVKDDRKSIHGQ